MYNYKDDIYIFVFLFVVEQTISLIAMFQACLRGRIQFDKFNVADFFREMYVLNFDQIN